MPIYLEPPDHNPGGPDGQGRNRLVAIGLAPRAQCALRPLTEGAFWESQDTRRARWGNCGSCDNDGDCMGCWRVRDAKGWPWASDEVVIRIDSAGCPWVMNRQDQEWGEFWLRTHWHRLAYVAATFERGEDAHGRVIIARRVET